MVSSRQNLVVVDFVSLLAIDGRVISKLAPNVKHIKQKASRKRFVY
jgi:hypothetical protein